MTVAPFANVPIWKDRRLRRDRKIKGSAEGNVKEEERPLKGLPAVVTALGALGGYLSVKAALQGYQHWRRNCLRTLVMRVCPVLKALEVDYWCDFGTLLGAHRDKDIILHDNDADIVLLNPNWDLLAENLRAKLPSGWRVYFVIPSEDPSIRWLRVSAGVGILDLYGGFHKPSWTNVSIPQGHGDLCDVPAHYIFPLRSIDFRGVSVCVPQQVESVLVHRYGEDYMVPRYMHKGRDSVEQGKLYAKLLSVLGAAGLRA